jgi:hypothetical protein
VLSHPAVVAILSFAIGVLCLAWWVFGRRTPDMGWRRAGWTAVAYVAALVAAYAVYYVNVVPTMIDTLVDITKEDANNGAGGNSVHVLVGGAVSDKSLGLFVRYVDNWGDWFWSGLLGIWAEFWAYFRTWPIVGAVLGFAAMLPLGIRRSTASAPGRAARRRLYLAGFAWAVSSVVFLLVGWRLNLYVRYSLFALPVIVLGVGYLLARVWESGKWGRALALLVTGFFVVTALTFWQYRINYGLK